MDSNFTDELNRIKRDAPNQRVDFTEPANIFTVWADYHSLMKYCGSCKTFESASILASEHVIRKDLYIVNTEMTPWGIFKF